MRRSRLGGAALASLLLHAVLLALLWRQAPVRPASPPPAPPALVVEVISSPPEAPAPPPPPQPPPPVARPEQPRPAPLPAPPPEPLPSEKAPPTDSPPEAVASTEPEPPVADAEPEPPVDGAEPEEVQPPAPVHASPVTVPPADAPLVAETEHPSLLPPEPAEGWSLPAAPEAPRGRTLRPGDPSLSPEALAAEEHARVSGRVQGFAEDDLATLRVENGLVHPYFSQIRTSLAKQLEGAPLFDVKSVPQQLVRSYIKDAERYGATGSPGPGPSDRSAPTPTERLESVSRGNPAHDSMRAFLQAGESMQRLAEPDRPDLVIILELRQAPDGQLREVKVVETSGNKAFDKYVLEAVPPALAKLTPPPAEAAGVRPEGIRTLWAVEGRVVYLKKLSEMEGQDAWYIASAAGLGLLSGRFEETTGEIYVIDLRNPKFVCRPRLLRVW